MAEHSETKLRILMFPWLAHGHISPFLQLAKRLSAKNFHIYFCSTAINLDSIKTTANKHSIELVQLNIPSSPDLPPELHTTKNLPSNLIPTLIHAFYKSSSDFSEILETLKPDLLIYDVFQPWAPKLAMSQGIPAIHFGITGAASLSFYRHLCIKGTDSTFPSQALYLRDHEKVKICEHIKSIVADATIDHVLEVYTMSSDIILVTSCRVVEEKYINYLGVLCKTQVVPTGPLTVHFDTDDNVDGEHSEIMKWLSGKSSGSTIYLSFGSEHFLTKSEIDEIAKGLQLCNANFVWVIRFPLGEENISLEDRLPEGFIDIVKDRGTVVTGWAPQARILSHPSIGGFLCHCGWNSIMESMYYGVPIIAVPMKYEQPITARMVVETGVGVEVESDEDGNYMGEEIAKAINKVILAGTTFCDGSRSTSKKLSEKIMEKEEGEMNEVADQLLRLCMKNKI